MAATKAEEIEVAGRTVRLTSGDKVYFPERGFTKGDVFRYYLAVGEGIMRALRERPTTLQRFPDGLDGETFFQKRIPTRGVPPWVETATIKFPSMRTADELCPTDLAHVAWAAQLGTIVFHPWPVRRSAVDSPDELRIDLDPLRANRRATVSTPVTWDELTRVEPDDFDLATVPARIVELGDPHASIDDVAHDLTPLLEWVERDERDGLGDMPYPPEHPKMPGEPMRVQPSKARHPIE